MNIHKLFESVVFSIGNEPIEVVKFHEDGSYYHIHPEIHKKNLWIDLMNNLYN